MARLQQRSLIRPEGQRIWGPIAALVGTLLAAAVVSILDSYKQSYALAPEVAVVTGDGGPAAANAPTGSSETTLTTTAKP